MTELAAAAWPEIPDRPLVLVPVGSLEQHGPHLPMDTDTVIAQAVAVEVARLLDDPQVLPVPQVGQVVVAPPLAYGSSGEHQSFPGTASIGTEALRLVLVELVRSLRTWAGRVVFVNAHGGNLTALTDTVRQLRCEGHDVGWVACATEHFDLHAGRTETSLMLHLRPTSVRLEHAEPGNTAPLEEILPTMLTHGVRAVSANGVLGDPTGASAEDGTRLLEQLARQVAQQLTSMVSRVEALR